MKNISLSPVTRVHAPYRFLCPIRSRRQLVAFALFLVFGLPFITVLLKLYDPGAPLAYILIPALVGGCIPVFALMPARLSVATRFHAGHLAHTLDASILALGYARSESFTTGARYQPAQRGWLGWQEDDIAVTVLEHTIEISGPVFAMRALQEKLAR